MGDETNFSLHDLQDLLPGSYLKDTSRLNSLEHQLSAPSRVVKEGSTPQPDEPLQIVMPTPSVAMGSGGMMPPPPSVGVMPMTAVTLSAAAVANMAILPPPAAHHQQPQFSFSEMNGMTLSTLLSHITINEQVFCFFI